MKKVIKNIGAIIIVCSMIVLGVVYLGQICSPFYTDDTTDAIKAFHEIEENSVEVMVYGSSHAWKGLDVMAMYEAYGIGGYNYGCNWQHINTTELFIRDSFRTQKPKVILIETYLVYSLLKNIDLNGEILYTREISNFEGKQKYLKQVFGDEIYRYVSYYVPLVAFHSNWNNLTRWSFDTQSYNIEFDKTMGYHGSDDVQNITMPDYTQFNQESLSEDALQVLDNIVKLCKENDVEIIFYTAPMAHEYKYFDAMKEYAEKTGTAYVNLFEHMDEMGFDPSTDFLDKGHLNNSGSRKVGLFLGEYIINNYEVTDMREIENNQWERNLQ